MNTERDWRDTLIVASIYACGLATLACLAVVAFASAALP